MMCKLLEISRQTYYNYENDVHKNKELELQIIDGNVKRTFENSRCSYGTRMVKAVLSRENIIYSRQTISKSMRRQNLVSSYNKSRKPKVNREYNKETIDNVLNRKFNQPINEVLTSDLTYVKVNNITYYVCFIVDLYNSEIVGYSVSNNKKPEIVLKAFNNINCNLQKTRIFHSDRGTEFKNNKIDRLLKTHNIQKSLSKPGSPVDNAKSESAFKTFKYSWYQNTPYKSEYELYHDVEHYYVWYNNIRPHSSLGYLSPVEYRLKMN